MQPSVTVLLFLAASLMMAAPCLAETEIDISGQVRARGIMDDRQMREEFKVASLGELRTRVEVHALVDDNTHAVVQFQDSRMMGRAADGSETSGTLTNSANVDIHQAYVQIDRLFDWGIGVKAGRFELNLGNERVFGAVGWNNVGRSWEGVEAWVGIEQFRLSGWALVSRMGTNPYERDSRNIWGLQASIQPCHLDLFAFRELDERELPDSDVKLLDRFDIGLHSGHVLGQFDWELNGVYQFGDRPSCFQKYDIAAYLVTLEAGLSFPDIAAARLAAGVDYASGDDTPDDEINYYDNLYYTAHKFRGYMDYHTGNSTRGLIDIVFRAGFEPLTGWKVMGDCHYFQRPVEYYDFKGNKTRDVGTELDLTVETSRIAGVTLTAGGSVYFPSEADAGFKDPETGLWGYLMATANFE